MTADFESFWNACPKGRRVGKGAARAAWNKAILLSTPADITAAMNAQVQHYGWESWPVEKRCFIPHPRTWLSQERWTDELDGPPDPFAPKEPTPYQLEAWKQWSEH